MPSYFGIGADALAASLACLFNMSVKSGTVPNDLKKKVIPVYKFKGEVENPSNYQPSPVLSHVAKLLEKCVQVQLLQYLDQLNLITCDQYAFLKHHSTQTALH